MSVKSNLKVILVQKKIKQIDLAAEIGVSQSTMNSLCNERTLPTLEVALKISSALNLSVNEIWELQNK